MYLLFTDQCNPSFETKLKGTKEYDKSHKWQDGIKHLVFISRVICIVEAHLEGAWVIMNANNHLHKFSQLSNIIINDYIKKVDA